jgi:charged multivesicular body protein 4
VQASDGILKKKEFYERRAENEVTKAKECLKRNDKKGATLALRRKKMVMSRMEALENSYLHIQEQILDLESLQTTTETFTALKEAAKAQKTALAKHDADSVQDVMDDLQESRQNMRDVQDAFELGGYQGIDIDEGELEDELAALEEEDLNKELLSKPDTSGLDHKKYSIDLNEELPEVPKQRPQKITATTSDKEAEDLLAELAL